MGISNKPSFTLRVAVVALSCSVVMACGQGGRSAPGAIAAPSTPELPVRAGVGDVARAGVAVVDASWHFGASAGQFAATGAGIDKARGFDPYTHAIRKVGSDILGTRITTRALVVEGVNGKRVAVVASDLYLPNDFMHRRIGQLLDADGTTGINAENLATTVSHSHTSPFYSTPAFGPWVFQDVFDLRFYEYMAQRMSQAVIEAAAALQPAKMGGTAFYANDIRAHTYGPKVATDGSPAGQPHDYTTRQAYVLRFDTPDTGKNFANWIVLGVHPEWVWGEEIMNGDVTHAIMRLLDRETGAITVMSQSETGTSGPHKDERAHVGAARREFQESNASGADRAARIFADNVHGALNNIAANTPWDSTQFAAMRSDFEVNSAFQRFAPPASRPTPGVSNCNTDRLYYELNPGVPIIGFPDCQFPLEPVAEPFEALGPLAPQVLLGTIVDELLALGVPLPTSISGPSLLLLEEQATVPIQAFKIGDVGVTFCPCEQFTDTALNIISRLNRVEGDLHDGWDWDLGYPNDVRKPSLNNSQDYVCWQSGEDEWSCPHPHQFDDSVLTMTGVAYHRMKAQIHNDANGWDDMANVLNMEAEPVNPAEIQGNFTHEELAAHAYGLVIPVGMANDYWGYMPAYREYRAHDHYRKALAGLGPHGADFLATRLSRLAASLNGHAGQPANAMDTVYLAEDLRSEVTSRALGELANVVTPVYEATLPNDGGTPQIIEQPQNVSRFSGAQVRWIGGSNYEGFPKVTVEREAAQGWMVVADMDGDIQLHLKFLGATEVFAPDGTVALPDPADLLAWRSGSFEWEWTANFEAFASELALPEVNAASRPQASYITPAGRYRFQIAGQHRGAGAYQLTSDVFEVRNAAAITAENLAVSGNAVRFKIGPVNAYSAFINGPGHDGNVIEVATPHVFGPIDYPDSYVSDIPWVRDERNLHTYREGEQDDQVYCHHCSFRPWLNVGAPAQVCASLMNGGAVLEQSCNAQEAGDGVWQVNFASPLSAADAVAVRVGDIQDQLGQSNADEFVLSLGVAR